MGNKRRQFGEQISVLGLESSAQLEGKIDDLSLNRASVHFRIAKRSHFILLCANMCKGYLALYQMHYFQVSQPGHWLIEGEFKSPSAGWASTFDKSFVCVIQSSKTSPLWNQTSSQVIWNSTQPLALKKCVKISNCQLSFFRSMTCSAIIVQKIGRIEFFHIDASAFNSVLAKSLFSTISEKNLIIGLNMKGFTGFHGMTKTNTKGTFEKLKETNESCNVRTNWNLIRVLTASESVCYFESPRLTLV